MPSKSSQDNQLFRILDANLNRTKEGFRVCEDISRYVWNKQQLTRDLKNLRHALTFQMAKIDSFKVLEARSVADDVGQGSIASEFKRQDMNGVFLANSQRVKESLRVLEEITKLIDPKLSLGIKKIRYQFYVQEQKAFKKS